ncbi:MAG: S8 family serine peptidase [Actinomycetota bacterium]
MVQSRARVRKLAGLTAITLLLSIAIALPAAARDDGSARTASVKLGGANSVYIVQLLDAPVSSYRGETRGYAATHPSEGKKIDRNNSDVKKYVSYLDGRQKAALDAVGATKIYGYHYSFNGFAAKLTRKQVDKLSKMSGVVAVRADERKFPTTDNSPEFLGLSGNGNIWDDLGGQGAAGEDVIIGVIDTGIWPEHPSFDDEGYDAPPAGWNGTCQTGEEWTADDCNHKLIGARYFFEGFGAGEDLVDEEYASARDADGHGTHTSSTAGGNAGVEAEIFGNDLGTGTLSGVAPRARVAMYKVCWNDEGCASVDLVAAIDQAVADGVDVINYSIGSDTPDLLSPDGISFLFAADAGVYASVSNGNAGPGVGTGGSPASVPWVTAVGASSQDRTFANTVTLGNGATYSGASVTNGLAATTIVDSADAGSELCIVGELDPAVVADNVVLCKRGSNARVEKSEAVAEAGGVGMVLYNGVSPQEIVTDNHFVPSTHVVFEDGLEIKAYIESAGETATAALSAGTFTPQQAPDMAAFSSRGPNGAAPDVIKPDVTAPGVVILAGNSPTPFLGAPGQLFQAISGTSMSSPHTAGVGALLRQAHPTWSPAQIKSALMTTAYQDVNKEDGETPADPFDMGAGHIDPTPANDPGLTYNTDFFAYLRFLCGAGALNPNGVTCTRAGSADPSDLNLASIGVDGLAGVQTVTRKVTNVGPAGTYRVSVDAPPGINVEVTPSTLNMAPRKPATYTVKFTNVSAPSDVWTFGSLTWSDGTHDVRSPIAIRPVPLAAPDELSLTGTSGSLDYDITFGFTGPFSADPHGLIPAATEAGNVVDDPANDIGTALETGVGITSHPVSVPADTRHLRVRTIDGETDGADDLDLYLFDPDGNLAGFSAGGTAEETIDLPFPAAGDYEVIVHGWQTDGPDSNYTLFTWVLGDAAEGNMTVTGPAAAVSGETATITLGWSGLSAGVRYFGTVSYSNGVEEVGTTRVAITG